MADILKYWHAVEMFDPHDIPRETRRGRREPGDECVEVIRVVPGKSVPLLPWQPGHWRYGEQPKQKRKGSAWRHTVYGGVFSFGAVREAFSLTFGYLEGEDFGGKRKNEDSALFAFTVDENGILIDDTGAFSSCAWATGRLERLRRGELDALDGFDPVAKACEQVMAQLLDKPLPYPKVFPRRAVSREKARVVSVVTGADAADGGSSRRWLATTIDLLGAAVAAAVGAAIGTLAPLLGTIGAAAASGAVGKAVDGGTKRLEQSIGGRPGTDEGAPASEDLGQPAQDRRAVQALDVVAVAAIIADILQLPEIMRNLLEVRVRSYPVERERNGTLPDPEPVFLASAVAPDLIRVAGAAPDGFGLALQEYLSPPLAADDRVNIRDDRAEILWGVRPDNFPLARWPADITERLAVSQQFAVNTILSRLADGGLFAVNGPPGTGKTTMLRDLIAAVIVQRAEVLATFTAPQAAFTPRDEWHGKNGKVLRINGPCDELTGFEIVVASSNNAAVENVTRELPAKDAVGKNAGGEKWFGPDGYFAEQATTFLGAPAWGMVAAPLGNAKKRKAFRNWYWKRKTGMRAHLMALQHGTAHAPGWEDAIDRFNEALEIADDLATRRADADMALWEPAEGQPGLSQEQITEIHKNALGMWGASFPGAWMHASQRDQELSSPWADDEWLAARTEVFLAALDLHRAFVAGAAGTIRFNLDQLCGALAGDPDALPPDAERAAWQTLFLLIPVISTTFASCGRMFDSMGRESLGWLLIDEAGQALPQHAVGVLWRAYRAVVVGDPRQLEPISQVPDEFQLGLSRPFRVPEQWIPAGCSAQSLADRRTPLGTTVPSDDEPVWVGAPLRVHRRCQQPMFGMSNTLAYDGLMVYGTRREEFPGTSDSEYPPSGWRNVTGPAGGGKWVPEQGQYLLKILRESRVRYGVRLRQIYVVSPFHDVAGKCKSLVEEELGHDGVPERERIELKAFVENNIGTVHKMQGKQADVVILMLGRDPSPSKRARDWAGNPVNLLNVAVSRARYRLLVIGEYEDWKNAPNFGVFEPCGDFPHFPKRERY